MSRVHSGSGGGDHGHRDYGWKYSDIRPLTHSGCLIFTGRNSSITGFRSMTGVPETASRPTTVSSRPWTDSMAPKRLGPGDG